MDIDIAKQLRDKKIASGYLSMIHNTYCVAHDSSGATKGLTAACSSIQTLILRHDSLKELTIKYLIRFTGEISNSSVCGILYHLKLWSTLIRSNDNFAASSLFSCLQVLLASPLLRKRHIPSVIRHVKMIVGCGLGAETILTNLRILKQSSSSLEDYIGVLCCLRAGEEEDELLREFLFSKYLLSKPVNSPFGKWLSERISISIRDQDIEELHRVVDRAFKRCPENIVATLPSILRGMSVGLNSVACEFIMFSYKHYLATKYSPLFFAMVTLHQVHELNTLMQISNCIFESSISSPSASVEQKQVGYEILGFVARKDIVAEPLCHLLISKIKPDMIKNASLLTYFTNLLSLCGSVESVLEVSKKISINDDAYAKLIYEIVHKTQLTDFPEVIINRLLSIWTDSRNATTLWLCGAVLAKSPYISEMLDPRISKAISIPREFVTDDLFALMTFTVALLEKKRGDQEDLVGVLAFLATRNHIDLSRIALIEIQRLYSGAGGSFQFILRELLRGGLYVATPLMIMKQIIRHFKPVDDTDLPLVMISSYLPQFIRYGACERYGKAFGDFRLLQADAGCCKGLLKVLTDPESEFSIFSRNEKVSAAACSTAHVVPTILRSIIPLALKYESFSRVLSLSSIQLKILVTDPSVLAFDLKPRTEQDESFKHIKMPKGRQKAGYSVEEEIWEKQEKQAILEKQKELLEAKRIEDALLGEANVRKDVLLIIQEAIKSLNNLLVLFTSPRMHDILQQKTKEDFELVEMVIDVICQLNSVHVEHWLRKVELIYSSLIKETPYTCEIAQCVRRLELDSGDEMKLPNLIAKTVKDFTSPHETEEGFAELTSSAESTVLYPFWKGVLLYGPVTVRKSMLTWLQSTPSRCMFPPLLKMIQVMLDTRGIGDEADEFLVKCCRLFGESIDIGESIEALQEDASKPFSRLFRNLLSNDENMTLVSIRAFREMLEAAGGALEFHAPFYSRILINSFRGSDQGTLRAFCIDFLSLLHRPDSDKDVYEELLMTVSKVQKDKLDVNLLMKYVPLAVEKFLDVGLAFGDSGQLAFDCIKGGCSLELSTKCLQCLCNGESARSLSMEYLLDYLKWIFLAFGEREKLVEGISDVAVALLDHLLGSNRVSDDSRTVSELYDRFSIFLPPSEPHVTWPVAISLCGAIVRGLPTGEARQAGLERLIDILTLDFSKSPQSPTALYNVLVPLFKVHQEFANQLIATFIDHLKSEDDNVRRGSGNGLAAVVKGLGVSCLSREKIVEQLSQLIKETKEAKMGAVFAFQKLSETLKISFEAKLIEILPMLLICYSDTSSDVRNATREAARTIMNSLSPVGAKIVLPAILDMLEHDQPWRTQSGAIELLGAMAYCNASVLTTALPKVVVKLQQVMVGTQFRVQEAAERALKQLGSVVTNREVRDVVPSLIAAIIDPVENTKKALEKLVETPFSEAIDTSSLALVIPVVKRGMTDRSLDSKKAATQIVYGMSYFCNPKDLAIYIPELLVHLQKALLDSISGVRSSAAKSVGALCRVMDIKENKSLSDFIEYLKKGISSEFSVLQRQGCAQGYATVLSELGDSYIEEFMSTVPQLIKSPMVSERHGTLLFLHFLPQSLGREKFSGWLDFVLPLVISALSDHDSYCSGEASQIVRVLITAYNSKDELDLIANRLTDEALSTDSGSSRSQIMELMSNLLMASSGESHSLDIIRKNLKSEIIDAMLSVFYVLRHDEASEVRLVAIRTWKTFVSHSVQVVRKIFNVLVDVIIGLLFGQSESLRDTGAETLNDLTIKVTDEVFKQVVPVLLKAAQEDDERRVIGSFFGLASVFRSSPRDAIEKSFEIFKDPLCQSIGSSSPAIRSAAALAFTKLHDNVGAQVSNPVLLFMLHRISSESQDVVKNRFIDGMCLLLQEKSGMLSFLVPKLMERPLSSPNASAIGALSLAVGSQLKPYLSNIVYEVVLSASDEPGIMVAANQITQSITPDTLQIFVNSICRLLENGKSSIRRSALEMVNTFIHSASEPFWKTNEVLFQNVFITLNDASSDVRLAGLEAIQSIVGAIGEEDYIKYVTWTRFMVKKLLEARMLQGQEKLILAFDQVGSLKNFLPMFTYLMNNVSYAAEEAAYGLKEFIVLASDNVIDECLKLVIGPLIHAFRNNTEPKILRAFIMTAKEILRKNLSNPLMKTYVCCFNFRYVGFLQSNFMNCLANNNKDLRVCASKALILILPKTSRLDDFFKTLMKATKGLKTWVAPTLYDTLTEAFVYIKRKGLELKDNCLYDELADHILTGPLANDLVEVRSAAARCLSAVIFSCPDEDSISFLIEGRVLGSIDGQIKWPLLSGILTTAAKSLELETPMMFRMKEPLFAKLENLILEKKEGFIGFAVPVRQAIVVLCSKIVIAFPAAFPDFVFATICKATQDGASDVRLGAAEEIGFLGKEAKMHNSFGISNFLVHSLDYLLPMISDRNIPVKTAAEVAIVNVLQLQPNDMGRTNEYTNHLHKKEGSDEATKFVDLIKRIQARMP